MENGGACCIWKQGNGVLVFLLFIEHLVHAGY